MEEDALPPLCLCSAPPPPLPPFPSVTPSCANDGAFAHRRSGRIQAIRAQTPEKWSGEAGRLSSRASALSPSPAKRKKERGNMVQVSEAKQPRVNDTHGHERRDEATLGFNFASERPNEPKVRTLTDAESGAELTAQLPLATESSVDAGAAMADESVSAPRGWVIGPLFQSFRSKMASFTEIVMSPVKLFRAHSPPPSLDCPEGGDGHTESGDVSRPQAQSVDANQERRCQGETAQTLDGKYSKKLSFEVEAEQVDERSAPDSVLRGSAPCSVPEDTSPSSKLCQPLVNTSASREPTYMMCGGEEEPSNKPATRPKLPQPRKCSGNKTRVPAKASRSQLRNKECETRFSPQMNSVTSDGADASLCGGDVVHKTPCRSLENHLTNNADGRIQLCEFDSEQSACRPRPAVAEREPKSGCLSREPLKRKRLLVDVCGKDVKKRELLDAASADGVARASRPSRKSVEEKLRPARKTPAVLTRANKKGRGELEVIAAINEAAQKQTETSTDAGDASLTHKTKPGPKSRAGLGKTDGNLDNAMALETTIAITAAKRPEPRQLAVVLVRPQIKQLHVADKKQQKRKSPTNVGSAPEWDHTAVSAPPGLSVQPEGQTPAGLNASEHNPPEGSGNKRPKKAVKSSPSGGRNLQPKSQERQAEEDKDQKSTDPVYFEMTPFESQHQHQPLPPLSQCGARLKNEGQHAAEGREKESAETEAGHHGGSAVSRRRSRGVNMRPRRENRMRKCGALVSRMRKEEEMAGSASKDDAVLTATGTRSWRRLLRSYSCPEIPLLGAADTPWSPLISPQHGKVPASHQHHPPLAHPPLAHHAHKTLRRARRHTVCSVEVEREIAPLCLRKEVYPSRRSVPFDAASQTLSPSTSLSALASCFLSSPLAFLSKKVDGRSAAASPGGSSHATSPSSSSSTWGLPGFLHRSDSRSAALDSGIPLQCDVEGMQQSEEEDDGGDTSSSSQEFEDVALREEKALSDSEIKVVQKHEERGKVSSIRIRKALPKPQNNLTPMGLPKPVRLKKKEFSLEEIYTNKNFNKPPESRLETIFEEPLKRRNGSESWFGQRRVKRFLEFLEVGEVRKPKKPLAGAGKVGIPSSRTRRGGSPKDEPSLCAQDVDSALCAKLDQLSLWLVHDGNDG